MPFDHLISFKGISKNFGNKRVIANFNLEIPSSSFVSIVGPSGCGKSTLLKLMAGLENPDEGVISTAKENDLKTSFVFQEPNLLPWKNVFENVRLPFEIGTLKNLDSTAVIDQKVKEIIERVKLFEAIDLFPHQLSGGMKMRVSIARSFITRPKILLMDEPFSALDEKTRFEMQDLLLSLWQEEKSTIVFVTHSIYEALYLSERVIVLNSEEAQIKKDIAVKFSLPRGPELRTSHEFNQYLQFFL